MRSGKVLTGAVEILEDPIVDPNDTDAMLQWFCSTPYITNDRIRG